MGIAIKNIINTNLKPPTRLPFALVMAANTPQHHARSARGSSKQHGPLGNAQNKIYKKTNYYNKF